MNSRTRLGLGSLALVITTLGARFFLLAPVPTGTESAQPATTLETSRKEASNVSSPAVAESPSPNRPVAERSQKPIFGVQENQSPARNRDSGPGAGPVPELTTAEPEGERTIAKISNDGVERTLTPNELGQFPRVYIKANQTVPVAVSFPDGQPDDPVVIQVEDGGGIDGKLAAKLDKLDPSKTVAFDFKANADLGVYRVVLRKGGDLRILDFWVGDEQPMAQR